MKTNKSCSKHQGSFWSELQLHTGRRSCFLTMNNYRWNNSTIVKFDIILSQASLPWFIVIQNLKSTMVWAEICTTMKTSLIFSYSRFKINKDMYRQNILKHVVLPWAQKHLESIFGRCIMISYLLIEQKSQRTVSDWCRNFPDFISA